MQFRGFFIGFFVFAVVLWATTPARAQSTRDLEADRLTEKLWRIRDITKQYDVTQFQAHVTLEGPDGERIALTLRGENAQTLIHGDVIVLDRKPGVHADVPEQEMGLYFIPRLPKYGKPRWWSQRIEHEGQEISKELKLLYWR